MVGTFGHLKIKLLHPGKVFLINDNSLDSNKRMKKNLLNIFRGKKGIFCSTLASFAQNLN